MYCRYRINFFDDETLEIILELYSLIQESNKIKLSLATQISCSNSSTNTSSITSNEIEGITKSDSNIDNARQADIYIANYNNILEYIKTYTDSITLSSNELLGWHSEMFKGTLKHNSCGGKFKTTNNSVIDENNNILFNGAEPFETPILVQELIDWYNTTDLAKVLKIIIFAADFLMIHPFNDGNGRMSRLIMNYLLIKEGFSFFKYVSLEKIILDHKTEYMQKLRTINNGWNTPDCNYSSLVKWFLEIFNKSLEDYMKMFNLSDLYNDHKINKEQLIIKVIDLLNENKTIIKRSTIINFIKGLNIKVSEQMVKNVLNKLVQSNYLILQNKGKNTSYSVTENFNEKVLKI